MAANFYDTNILVYLASRDPQKADKAERAISLGGTVSVQVLNEFAHVARRKMSFTWPEVHDFLGTIRSLLKVLPVGVEVHDLGLELSERHGFAIYDAMIIAAALTSDCDTLFTEDLQHGRRLGPLTVINPLL